MTVTDGQFLVLALTGLGILVSILVVGIKGGRWSQRVDQQLADHRAVLTNHASLLDGILQSLRELTRRLPPFTVAKGSPLRLTELGEQIAEALGAEEWARELAESLHDRVAGMRPDQIHEFCFAFVYNEHQPDTDLETAISVAAYENGIDKSQVIDVLAIVLRDILSSERALP